MRFSVTVEAGVGALTDCEFQRPEQRMLMCQHTRRLKYSDHDHVVHHMYALTFDSSIHVVLQTFEDRELRRIQRYRRLAKATRSRITRRKPHYCFSSLMEGFALLTVSCPPCPDPFPVMGCTKGRHADRANLQLVKKVIQSLLGFKAPLPIGIVIALKELA